MACYWLTSLDGSISFNCQAEDAAQAFELLARARRYASWQAFCDDLVYSTSDFRVAMVEVERVEYDSEGNRKMLNSERDGLVTSAFKHLRRLSL